MRSQDLTEKSKPATNEYPLSLLATELSETFSLKKLTVYPKRRQPKTIRISAIAIRDVYGPLEKFIADGKKSLLDFKKECSSLLKDSSTSYNTKLKDLLRSQLLLDQQAKAHNIENRFSLTTRTVLFVSTYEGKDEQKDFSDFEFTEEQKNEMKEYFQVRYEYFNELLSLTNLCIADLEISSFRYARFKLKEPAAKRLLWEFVFALENDKDLIELNPADKRQFEEEVFKFFGVSNKDRGKVVDNLFRDRKIHPLSKGLGQLRDKFTSLKREDLV